MVSNRVSEPIVANVPLQQDDQPAARRQNEYATLKKACKTEMNDLRGVVKTAEDANDYTTMINGKL